MCRLLPIPRRAVPGLIRFLPAHKRPALRRAESSFAPEVINARRQIQPNDRVVPAVLLRLLLGRECRLGVGWR